MTATARPHRLPRFLTVLASAQGAAWCVGLAITLASGAQAQVPAAPGKVTVAKPAASGPSWAELQPAQQQALAPLAQSWAGISESQKRKWLQMSKGYAKLSPEGQATMHSRMNEWVMLSPQQRTQARLNFATTRELSKQLTPEQKQAKWQSYQALSAEEKQKLAATAVPRPAGAATAIRPVAPQKLAPVTPGPSHLVNKPATKIAPSQPVPAAAGVSAPAEPSPPPQR